MKRSLKLIGVCAFMLAGMVALGAWQTQQNFPLPTGLSFTLPTLTISSATNGNGVLALSGNTSGTATFTAPAVAGTATNPVVATNSLSIGGGEVYGWANPADTGLSRAIGGVIDVGTGAAGSTAGFLKTAQTLQVITTNYTTTGTTLAGAGVVTGLNFTAPANLASNWSFHCDLIYSQATAAAANLFGVTTAGTAPTNLLVGGEVLTSNVAVQVDGNAIITTATSTTVVTATPSAAGAIGTSADMFVAHIWGTLEAPSNATPTQVGIAVASGSASDALTIYRGSACWWY